jgi:predicted dehydrogenase
MTNLAIIGCGGEAVEHAKILKGIPDCRVTALVSPTDASREKLRTEFFEDAREYAELDDLLADPPDNLSAVLLLTPHNLHYPQAKAAVEAGLNVLTEKPMVTSADHAMDLFHAVQKSGKQLGITFQAPYSAAFQHLKKLRTDGDWGRAQLIQGYLAQGWMADTLMTWRQDPALSGGGQMYDSGSHVLNAMLWLTGEDVSEVGCFVDHCGTPVDINGTAIIKFSEGTLGSVAIGGNSPGWDTRISLQTDRFQAHTDPHGDALQFLGSDEIAKLPLPKDDSPAAFTPHRNFIDALEGREPLQCGLRDGVRLSLLMDALYESARTGQIVKPKPEPKAVEAEAT